MMKWRHTGDFMNEYIDKLNIYLPIDFANEENNAYRQYLLDSFHENCEKGKYQFAIMAFHMLFMSFLYKEFWELKSFSIAKVSSLCRSNANFGNINDIFDASVIPEKTMIDQYLGVHSWHINKKDAVKSFVDKRDNCAHASGFIQYNQDEAERYFLDVLDYTEKISKANKSNTVQIFQEKLIAFFKDSDEFNSKTCGEFIFELLRKIKISLKDICYIVSADMPKYVIDDESGIFKVAYYFAMIQLHFEYIQSTAENALDLTNEYFIDTLYLFLETLEPEKKFSLQVQVEDEIEYLNSYSAPISLRKISTIIQG